MASIYGIIPEYILQGIIRKGLILQHVINQCQSTIKKIKQLQDVCISYRESIAAAPRQRTSQGIISFYILESLSRNAVIEQQCEAARHTLAYSTKYRTDITATRRPNRIVYDAQNSRAEFSSRNKVLIHEGGPLLTLE